MEDRPEIPPVLGWVSLEQLEKWRQAMQRIYQAIVAQLGVVKIHVKKEGWLRQSEYSEIQTWRQKAKTVLHHLLIEMNRIREEMTRRRMEESKRSQLANLTTSAKNEWKTCLYNFVQAIEDDEALSPATREVAAEFLDFLDRENDERERVAQELLARRGEQPS